LLLLVTGAKNLKVDFHLVLVDLLVEHDEALCKVGLRDPELLRQVGVILVTVFEGFRECAIEDKPGKSEVFGDPAESVDNLLVVSGQLLLKDLLEGLLDEVVAAYEAGKVLDCVFEH